MAGFIFVVDSCDRERIQQVRDVLHWLVSEDELKKTAFLVLANKQDLEGAMDVKEVTERLELEKIKERKWFVQGASVKNGSGVQDGFDWLTQTISKLK